MPGSAQTPVTNAKPLLSSDSRQAARFSASVRYWSQLNVGGPAGKSAASQIRLGTSARPIVGLGTCGAEGRAQASQDSAMTARWPSGSKMTRNESASSVTSPSRTLAGWSLMLASRWPLPGSMQAGHGQLARSQDAEMLARSQETERPAGSAD